jgi:hypothetical protein
MQFANDTHQYARERQTSCLTHGSNMTNERITNPYRSEAVKIIGA